jgi:uncharacterized membrane protein
VRVEELAAPPIDDPAAGRQRRVVAGAAVAALAFYGLAFATPLIERASAVAGAALRLGYAPLCHQDPARSLSTAGAPQAVCARCAGIYLGAAIGLAAAAGSAGGRWSRPRPLWLGALLVPTAADALAARVGWPSLANAPRFSLAIPLGLVTGLFLAVGIADLARPRAARAASRPVAAAD